MQIPRRKISVVAIAVALTLAAPAFGHVRISPAESRAGATERYTMRVPTERQSSTVRIELRVPAAVVELSLTPAPGWRIEEKKDAQGRITEAIWSGGSIPFAEYREFTFDAKNPAKEMKLEWKVIQIYEDGTRSEWTGPEGSRSPGPVTVVKTVAAQ